MTSRVPLKLIAAVVGTAVLLLIAFLTPTEGEPFHVSADSADGAALLPVGPGVTSPPEPQPPANLAQPQPGQQPTQVVVVSVDGGCETSDGTIRRLLDVGRGADARFTFFISGLCLLPDAERMQYRPPGKPVGQSDIGFADAGLVAERVRVFSDMYRSGNEIGTHFLGHFCGSGGVKTWTTQQWKDEIAQARQFLDQWPQNNPQAAGTPPLPFDSTVFKGDRTPCLEGDRAAMFPAFVSEGFRYDASDPGALAWPKKVADGALWQFPLQALKLEGTDLKVLSMDYNLLVNQNDGKTDADPATCQRVEQQTYDTFMRALRAAHEGNRAPLILGSHLNDWVCGAYINSLERFITDAHKQFPDVRFVSFQDLADWLDGMDPALLTELQQRGEQQY